MQPPVLPPPPLVMPPPPSPPPSAPPSRPPGWAIGVGLLLVVPAGIGLLIGYVWPTVKTIWWSFQARTPFGGSAGWAGIDNYSVGGERVGDWLRFTIPLGVLPLAALLVVGPLLAIAAHHAGKPVRLTARVVLGVLMAGFAPVAVAVAWWLDDPVPASRQWIVAGMTLFGLAAAVGITLYLAVLRGRAPGRSAWPAGLVVGALAAITVVALALQAFTFPFLFGGSATPMLDAYRANVQQLDLGAGAAFATLVLVPVMLLGVGAAVLVIASGLRAEVVPGPAVRGKPLAAVAAVIGLVLLAVVTVTWLRPWLAGLGRLEPNVDLGGPVLEGPPAVRLVARTWAPTAVSAAVGVGLAALAGYGIGGLRPLGRWSEGLLLPFAPWLFIGVGPLFLVKYDSASHGLVERVDTVLGLIPPVWLVVPALFTFTLLFRGLARSGHGYWSMLLRALPMVALVGAATWLVQSQSLLWPSLVATDPDLFPAQVFLLAQLGFYQRAADEVPLGLLYPLPILVVLAAAAVALQLFYLDRLAIRVGPHR